MSLENFTPNQFPATFNSILSALLNQSIQNHALLQTVLREQAVIMSKLDPSVDPDDYFDLNMEDVSHAVDKLKASVFSGL